jgi:hypothetical protein
MLLLVFGVSDYVTYLVLFMYYLPILTANTTEGKIVPVLN